MAYDDNEIVKSLKLKYEEFTNVEKRIADFFIQNKEPIQASSKEIAKKIYVSEASLSRFAKKCGYKGLREFIFEYEKNINISSKEDISNLVINTYQNILYKFNKMLDQNQLKEIAKMLTQSKRVFVFGMGSSGIAAEEMYLRFMRLGLNIESVSDSHRIKMLASLSNEKTVVIGISLSGTTKEILEGISIAKFNRAKIIMITSNRSFHISSFCDELILVPTINGLEAGDCISPQIPILVMIDLLYTHFIEIEHYYENKRNTLNALCNFEDSGILI